MLKRGFQGTKLKNETKLLNLCRGREEKDQKVGGSVQRKPAPQRCPGCPMSVEVLLLFSVGRKCESKMRNWVPKKGDTEKNVFFFFFPEWGSQAEKYEKSYKSLLEVLLFIQLLFYLKSDKLLAFVPHRKYKYNLFSTISPEKWTSHMQRKVTWIQYVNRLLKMMFQNYQGSLGTGR